MPYSTDEQTVAIIASNFLNNPNSSGGKDLKDVMRMSWSLLEAAKYQFESLEGYSLVTWTNKVYGKKED